MTYNQHEEDVKLMMEAEPWPGEEEHFARIQAARALMWIDQLMSEGDYETAELYRQVWAEYRDEEPLDQYERIAEGQ